MKVSGIVSPDVAPLTTVQRRLVISAFKWVTLHADVSILVSMPLPIYIYLNLSLISANVKRMAGSSVFRSSMHHRQPINSRLPSAMDPLN